TNRTTGSNWTLAARLAFVTLSVAVDCGTDSPSIAKRVAPRAQVSLFRQDVREGDARRIQHQRDRTSACANHLTGNLAQAPAAKLDRAAERGAERGHPALFDLVADAELRAVDHLVHESPNLERRTFVQRVHDPIKCAAR